jgi:hypothetical protein
MGKYVNKTASFFSRRLSLVAMLAFSLGLGACTGNSQDQTPPPTNQGSGQEAKQVASQYSVSSCGGNKIPVTFSIDCSNLPSNEWSSCQPYIQNVACLAFPAYQKITNVHLESRCPEIQYTLYTSDNWPHTDIGAGGLSYDCKSDYVDIYSINNDGFQLPSGSSYDAHEILHQFQTTMNLNNTAEHPLFRPSMAEAMKLIGDTAGFDKAVQSMQSEHDNFVNNPGLISGQCINAQLVQEEGLYLKDNNNIYKLYSNLLSQNLPPDAPVGVFINPWYEVFESKALYEVSGNNKNVKDYLINNGCSKF